MVTCRRLGLRLFGVILILLSLYDLRVSAQAFYSFNGVEECADAAQLWYEGYWKDIDWVNGTIARWPDDDVKGKIALFDQERMPYESLLRKAIYRGAIAVLTLRSEFPYPGVAMYFIDGSDRRRITIPIIDAVFGHSFKHADCPDTPKSHLNQLKAGAQISIRPLRNRYKEVTESRFNLASSIILSVWQTGIVVFGIYRIHQLVGTSPSSLFTTGPICCFLEVFAALLRLAYTCTDPFYSWRILPDIGSSFLISMSFPFSLSAGIILCFYWAEMLNKTNLRVQPFISKYRPAAIGVIIFMLTVELICDLLRGLPQLPYSTVSLTTTVTAVIYVVVGIVLVVCYLICALGVWKRLRNMPGNNKRRSIRVFTWRIASSTAGYIIFVLSLIAFVGAYRQPWGKPIVFFIGYNAHNWAATMQIAATRPRKTTDSNSNSRNAGSGTIEYSSELNN